MKLPGPFDITRVVDLDTWFRAPDFLFPQATPEAFAATRIAKDARFVDVGTSRLILTFHSLIVRTARHVILVDTCIGNHKERPVLPDWHRRTDGDYLRNLAAVGLAPEQITHVLCTHLHADHVGWNTRLLDGRWVPTFPNAKYVMHKVEFEHAERAQRTEPGRHRFWDDSVQPIVDAKQALIVAGDHEIEPGVRLMPCPGHTPGNVVVVLDDGRSRAYLVGDTIHHPVQIERPQWSSAFCFDPALSAKTRAKFLGEVADSGAWIIPAHFAPPCAVRVVAEPGGFWFKTAAP